MKIWYNTNDWTSIGFDDKAKSLPKEEDELDLSNLFFFMEGIWKVKKVFQNLKNRDEYVVIVTRALLQ